MAIVFRNFSLNENGTRCRECSATAIAMDFDYGARYCKTCGAVIEEVLYA